MSAGNVSSFEIETASAGSASDRPRVDALRAAAQLHPHPPGQERRQAAVVELGERRRSWPRRPPRAAAAPWGRRRAARRTGSGARNAASPPGGTTVMPPGLRASEPILATTLQVADAERAREPHALAHGELHQRRLLARIALGEHEVALVDPDLLHHRRDALRRATTPAATTRGRCGGRAAGTRRAGSGGAPRRCSWPSGCRSGGPRSWRWPRRRGRPGRRPPPPAGRAAPGGGAARPRRRTRPGRGVRSRRRGYCPPPTAPAPLRRPRSSPLGTAPGRSEAHRRRPCRDRSSRRSRRRRGSARARRPGRRPRTHRPGGRRCR